MAKSATTASRRLISITQASDYADVHPVTVRRWISTGRLPGYRVGPRLLKVDMNDLDAMLRPVATAGGGVR